MEEYKDLRLFSGGTFLTTNEDVNGVEEKVGRMKKISRQRVRQKSEEEMKD